VAHKIGTPLTALSGHIQLLQEDPQLSSEARRRIETVEAQIERTSRIIQDLLVYARKPELTLSPLDLNECLNECVTLLQPQIDRLHVTPVVALTSNVGKVEADPHQPQEVFCHLIENALDAMPNGGTLAIRSYPLEPSQSDAPGRQAVVEITDTGDGIAREHLDQIFQPFFTTKRAGQGTGLGLAVVQRVAEAHGGSVEPSNRPGRGARFRLLLPARAGGKR
jgi:signal transduction histidine kinase